MCVCVRANVCVCVRTCVRACVRFLILIIKPTRCTNFSNLFFGIKLYMFRTVPMSIICSFSLYTQQRYMLYRFADSCLNETCRVSSKKNKFEKLVYLVGFVTRIYHDSRLNLRFIRPENSNCDFAERKILILLKCSTRLNPKSRVNKYSKYTSSDHCLLGMGNL